MIVHKPRTSKS